jgi:hypothetical protein
VVTPAILSFLKKWASELNRVFSREEVQMTKKKKKIMKKMFNIPDHKGSGNQITLRLFLTPVGMSIIKNTNSNKCW